MLQRARSVVRWIRERVTRRVAWDLFMVYLALVNLGLILFDATYLWLRPTYFRFVPVITGIYDPVKGIEPGPLTEAYLEQVALLSAERASGATSEEQDAVLTELRRLSAEIIEQSPFARTGQEHTLVRIVVGMSRFLEEESADGGGPGASVAEVFDRFWSLPADPEQLDGRLEFFERELAPLMAVNYHRTYDLDGQLADHFWMLDLPFLLVFAAEFLIRWTVALRRGEYARWFFFPIFNWYDLLGIMPIKGLRLFRLFRIVSIYIRLHRSEHSRIGDDPISRLVKYFANIISEEISDMVALRILNDTQEELRDGTHRRIVRAVAGAHRTALADQLALQTRELLTSDQVRTQARNFLSANLEHAVDSAEALRRLPLPDMVLRPLVSTVGHAVFEAIADTLAATLTSEEGQQTVRAMILEGVDGLVHELTEGELEEVVREISMQVIQHMKETVAVRKWALPNQPRRSVFTRDLID